MCTGRGGQRAALTVVEVAAELVVGAAFHHFGDVLCLLVDWHGPDDGAWGRGGGHLDLDGTCFCDLTVEFLQQGGVLEKKRRPAGECLWARWGGGCSPACPRLPPLLRCKSSVPFPKSPRPMLPPVPKQRFCSLGSSRPPACCFLTAPSERRMRQ